MVDGGEEKGEREPRASRETGSSEGVGGDGVVELQGGGGGLVSSLVGCAQTCHKGLCHTNKCTQTPRSHTARLTQRGAQPANAKKRDRQRERVEIQRTGKKLDTAWRRQGEREIDRERPG